LSNFDSIQDINIGSSLKFCLLAEGKADLYPRLGPTSEWDTAAGEAILKYSGGYLLTIDGKKMNYNNSEALLNPYFIASSDESYIQKFIEYY
jgi:3'(2'), 5'-bisphosphate nucleotidase